MTTLVLYLKNSDPDNDIGTVPYLKHRDPDDNIGDHLAVCYDLDQDIDPLMSNLLIHY